MAGMISARNYPPYTVGQKGYEAREYVHVNIRADGELAFDK
jgi:hypothetical protein